MGRGGNSAVSKKPVYTLKDVAKHCTRDDCWLVYRSRVFDVSSWAGHPGGNVIFTHAGRDATDVFNSFHPASAYAMLDRFHVGDLAAENRGKMTPFARDMELLRVQVKKAGWQHASPLYYAWKLLSNVMIWAAGVACCAYAGSSYAMVLAGAFLIGLFWQQCGWLAHDFLHHQCFNNRFFNDLVGIIVGNVWQGFSVEWWKNKHNTHHAIPNMHETETGAHDGDPDIDTMPLLAWSMSMARKVTDHGAVGRFFIRHQAFLYFPILLIARMSWLYQSFSYVFRFQSSWTQTAEHGAPLRLGKLEHLGLVGYYLWYIGIMVAFLSPGQAIVFALASQMMCGFMLALAFGLGHNGMACYDATKTPEYYEWQITTTRNVHGSWLVGWFMGGLHLQVEHHLFPEIPRHNLGKLRKLVEPLCAKHGIPYTSTTMWTGTKDVLSHLASVTTELVAEFPGL